MSNQFYKSEACFRRYEPFITNALTSFPNAICFTAGLSPNTDSARCNDAIKSYLTNRWPVADEALFATLEARNLRAWVDPSLQSAVLGPGQNVRKPRGAANTTIIPANPVAQVINASDPFGSAPMAPITPEHVQMLVELIDSSIITFPVSIPDQWASVITTAISDRLNIAVRHEPPNIILF